MDRCSSRVSIIRNVRPICTPCSHPGYSNGTRIAGVTPTYIRIWSKSQKEGGSTSCFDVRVSGAIDIIDQTLDVRMREHF